MIKLLLLVTLCGHVISQSEQVFRFSVLTAHNTERAKYGARPLTWSDALYPGALQWARQCKFTNSPSNGRYGETLYTGANPNTNINEAVKAWMNEAVKYNYNNPVFSREYSHFTQIVWKSTTEVACAINSCPAGSIFPHPAKFVVCRYTPPGNYIGQFSRNVGRHV